MSNIKSIIVSIIFITTPSFAEEITKPGDWKYESSETTFIKCINKATNLELGKCQLSKGGEIYTLSCPKLETIKVKLKRLENSVHCYAQREECVEPLPCAILEKVVHQISIDYCQHGEIKTDRQCEDKYLYKIDANKINNNGNKIVDQCCRKIEVFSRPGVSL